jgi:LPXTG-site transpeptidase (sortase) family protein
VIPKIGKNIPLIDVNHWPVEWQDELNKVFMKELEKGVIRYPGSAKPGEDGVTFIFWHSSNFPWAKWEFNEVFWLLDKVSFDDDIIIYFNSKKYMYKIREKQVIKPWDVSILKRNKKKNEVSIMTCWPLGTDISRLVVTGELVEANN